MAKKSKASKAESQEEKKPETPKVTPKETPVAPKKTPVAPEVLYVKVEEAEFVKKESWLTLDELIETKHVLEKREEDSRLRKLKEEFEDYKKNSVPLAEYEQLKANFVAKKEALSKVKKELIAIRDSE